jgi:5-dehydro-2-deoxygluconokinase
MIPARIALNRFLVLGRAGMDLYADPPGTRADEAEQFSTALGGSAANIAVGLVRLGAQASLLTTVSDDAVGRYVGLQLQNYRVATTHVGMVRGEQRTSLAVVETRNVDTQSVIYRNNAADFELSQAQVRAIDYDQFGALVITGTALAEEPSRSSTFLAMELAREARLALILDIDYRPYSWRDPDEAASINRRAVEFCDAEFEVVFGRRGRQEAQALARDHGRTVIYKMGEKGSFAFREDTVLETGIYPVEALKPTGAGDAFMAGFATGLARGFDLKASVLRGTAAAAIVVTRVGCAPAMPSPVELDAFMAEKIVSA